MDEDEESPTGNANAGLRGDDKFVININCRVIGPGGYVILMIDNQIVRKLDESLTYLEKEKRVSDVVRLTVLREGRLHLERIKNQSELYYVRGIIDDYTCWS